jgi:hypothetical protein
MDIHYNSEVNTNNSTCDGAGCFKQATQTIVEKVGAMGTITLQLCMDCTNSFCVNSVCNSTKTKKKEFEHHVVRSACSNSFDQNQSSQQHEVPSND